MIMTMSMSITKPKNNFT